MLARTDLIIFRATGFVLFFAAIAEKMLFGTLFLSYLLTLFSLSAVLTKSESVLNPGNITGGRDKKEMAKPYAKIEAIVNARIPQAKINSEIWTDEDFKEEAINTAS